MRDIKHSRLEPFISTARLGTYNTFFAPNDQIELLGCYLWNKEVAAAFFPLLQVFEITLRNSIHKEASNLLGAYWFDNLASKPLRNLNSMQQWQVKQHANSIDSARKGIRSDLKLSQQATIAEDRIVAKVTFGFWTNLFGVPFDVNRNPRSLWPSLLRPVFPNAPKTHRKRGKFQGKLLAIKSFRNKAFHHEPVWNMGRPATVTDSISRLLGMMNTILEVLSWMSKDSVELVHKAGYVGNIERICSIEHLNYLRQPGSNNLPISRAKRELRKLVRSPGNTKDITLKGVRVGKIISGR